MDTTVRMLNSLDRLEWIEWIKRYILGIFALVVILFMSAVYFLYKINIVLLVFQFCFYNFIILKWKR
jgi:hypothetical protein